MMVPTVCAMNAHRSRREFLREMDEHVTCFKGLKTIQEDESNDETADHDLQTCDCETCIWKRYSDLNFEYDSYSLSEREKELFGPIDVNKKYDNPLSESEAARFGPLDFTKKYDSDDYSDSCFNTEFMKEARKRVKEISIPALPELPGWYYEQNEDKDNEPIEDNEYEQSNDASKPATTTGQRIRDAVSRSSSFEPQNDAGSNDARQKPTEKSTKQPIKQSSEKCSPGAVNKMVKTIKSCMRKESQVFPPLNEQAPTPANAERRRVARKRSVWY